LAGGDASLLNCEFTRCQVRAYVSEEECLLLTMKTVEMYYQWAGAVLYIVASKEFASALNLGPSDLACSNSNSDYCEGEDIRDLCKCRCNSNAERILQNQSIANFTMACAANTNDQVRKICIDAATQGTSFGVVITTGAFPFAVAWTLGTEAAPTAYITEGKATEIRPFEPFADPRSASSGFGGGEFAPY
jgi:hypothetical protein